MKKIIIILISFVICIIIVAAILLKLNIDLFNENAFDIETTKQKTVSITQQDNSSKKFFHARLEEGTNARIVAAVDPDNSDNTYDLEISFNKLSVSKKKGDFDLLRGHNKESVDENGTITNGYSYVIINVTLSSVSEHEFETTLNNMWLCVDNLPEYFELRSYNSNRNAEYDKHYYLVNFTKGFKQNYNLVFIMEDNVLKNIKPNKDIMLLCSFVNEIPNNLEDIPIVKKEK